jgi:hypothetical protein
MLILRCDEATVYAVVVAVSAIFVLLAVLRAVVHLLGSLVSRAITRMVTPAVEGLLCATVSVVSVAIFADSSALLPALMLLATATSAALCRSMLSFRWLWASSFAFYGVLLLNLIGPLLAEDVDVTRQEWSALVRGQHVLLPPWSSALTAGSPGSSGGDGSGGGRLSLSSRYVYSFFDSVKIEGSTSPLAKVAPRSPKPSMNVLSWLHLTWIANGGGRGEGRGSRRRALNTSTSNHRRSGKEEWDALPTRHVIASGDETLFTHYAELQSGNVPHGLVVDSIFLLGERSRLQHSHIHCVAPAPAPSLLLSASHAHPPCLRLHHSTMLRNVSIYWSELPDIEAAALDERNVHWRAFHTGHEAAQTCAEVQRQLAVQMGYAVGGAEGSTNPAYAFVDITALLDCVDAIDVSALPPSFVDHAPLPVRFGWHFPGYFHRVQESFLVFSDRVILPLAVFFGNVLDVCGQLLGSLFAQMGALFVEAMPHVKHAAEEVSVYTGGLVCGAAPQRPAGSSSPSSPSSSLGRATTRQGTVLHAYVPSTYATARCAAFSRVYASYAAFQAGVKTRKSALVLLSTFADAADVFPGMWTVCRWAWDAEVAITLRVLSGFRMAGRFLLFDVPPPLLRVCAVLVRGLGVVSGRLGTPLRALWVWLTRLPILPYASRLLSWLWDLEACWLRYEWAVLRDLGSFLGGQSRALFIPLTRAVSVACHLVGELMARYGRTSFSIHIVVTVIQSLLLLVAMRNEMRELIEAEHRRTTSPHSPLRVLTRFFPSSVQHYLPLPSITARVNGFVLLVRAHHQACMNYLLLHFVGVLVLIGLSALPFTSKLYYLSLRYVLPWLSAKAFLVFFDDPPSTRATAVLVVLRVILSTILQQTVGDFLYYLVRDAVIALGVFGGVTLLLWAWPQRTELAKQVASAIADSLQGTPMPTPQRGGPSPAQPSALSDSPPCEAEAGGDVRVVQKNASDHLEDKVSKGSDDAVNKQIDLSEAV